MTDRNYALIEVITRDLHKMGVLNAWLPMDNPTHLHMDKVFTALLKKTNTIQEMIQLLYNELDETDGKILLIYQIYHNGEQYIFRGNFT